MVVLSVWGAGADTPGRKIGIHVGPGGFDSFASKTVGLLMWPAVGLLLAGLQLAIPLDARRPVFITPVLALCAYIQYRAIRRAIERDDRADEAPKGRRRAEPAPLEPDE